MIEAFFFYQDKVAKEIGFKHLLEPISSDFVVLGQQSFRCGEHMNHISETAEDSGVTFNAPLTENTKDVAHRETQQTFFEIIMSKYQLHEHV